MDFSSQNPRHLHSGIFGWAIGFHPKEHTNFCSFQKGVSRNTWGHEGPHTKFSTFGGPQTTAILSPCSGLYHRNDGFVQRNLYARFIRGRWVFPELDRHYRSRENFTVFFHEGIVFERRRFPGSFRVVPHYKFWAQGPPRGFFFSPRSFCAPKKPRPEPFFYTGQEMGDTGWELNISFRRGQTLFNRGGYFGVSSVSPLLRHQWYNSIRRQGRTI